MKNNLINLIKNSEIVVTGAKPKLPTTIPNLTDTMLSVYRIPLKYLFYNDENGRISTQLKRKKLSQPPQREDEIVDYNDMFSKFIEEDNPKALKKTKESILEKGQQVYGYVLSDGRIIDGNRRFTALRKIEKETGLTQYFEAVILPFNYDAKAERAQIKRLELAIQMGVEEKLRYDTVDLAVDIYQTIKEDELMSIKDYSIEANISVKEIENRIESIEVIHDFLEFINAERDCYYIIKDLALYNPLYELAKNFKALFPSKGPKYELTKEASFALLGKMVSTGGDTVREVRGYIKDVVKSSDNDTFNNEIEHVIDDYRDNLDETPTKSASDYRKKLEILTPELRTITEKYTGIVGRQKKGKNVESFISTIKEMEETLVEIGRGAGVIGNLQFSNFEKKQLIEIRDYLVQISIMSTDLIEVYEDEL